jgi:radical SAM protein (TIGR01212 family)
MQKRYYDLNTYFRNQYGQRVHKITVDAGLTCPNRDGTLAVGGCIYCNARGSGTGAHGRGMSIARQIAASKGPVAKRFKAKLFMVYFQSFSNTYAPVEHLKGLYDQALMDADMIGLAIGTRPDCIDRPKLDLLEAYARDRLIWIEYGLQSAWDETLRRINRGHSVRCFEKAVRDTAGRGIKICVHMIIGLPGETADHVRATADYLARLPIDGVKLHSLYVTRGTRMETLYRNGEYNCLTRGQYVGLLCDVLERLPKNVVIQRLTGDPHPKELIAPGWTLDKRKTMELIGTELESRDTWQGRRLRGLL